MAITTSQARRLPRLPSLSCLPLLFCCLPASALDWLVQPSLRLRQSYTDNALLAPRGQAHSDLITEIAPGIALLGDGPRLQVQLDASWRKFLSRRSSDSDRRQLQASGHADLVRDWLQLDARASVSQQSISPFGAPLLPDLPDAANQSTVRAASISPFLRHAFPALGTAELRYTRSQVSSDRLLSSSSDEAEALFASTPLGRGWTWNTSYRTRRTEDSRLAPQRMERASAGLRYPFSRSWAGTASAGTEKEGYESSSGRNPRGRFWNVGGAWTPSARTSVAFSTGKRFFGRTYSLDASLLQRHTSWSLRYSEDITTMPAQFLRLGNRDAAGLLDQLWRASLPDAQQRRLRIDAFLRYANSLGPELGAFNYFSHRYFLQKQLTLTMARATPRSTLLAGLHAIDRTAQTASGVDSGLLPEIDLSSTDRTRQLGASAGWQWRSSPRSSLRFDAGYGSTRSLSAPRRDDNLTLTAGLSHIVQPKMTASIEVRHTRHHGRQRSSARNDFSENGLVATLTMQF